MKEAHLLHIDVCMYTFIEWAGSCSVAVACTLQRLIFNVCRRNTVSETEKLIEDKQAPYIAAYHAHMHVWMRKTISCT
jgi:hypothetical protein